MSFQLIPHIEHIAIKPNGPLCACRVFRVVCLFVFFVIHPVFAQEPTLARLAFWVLSERIGEVEQGFFKNYFESSKKKCL